jgi:diguanylate cyclase (GGDEF)-like protein/PAS domain S-box-containing protein
VRLRPLADDHDVEYWVRQIRIGAWIAVGLTLLGCVRVAAAWDGHRQGWLLPLAGAALAQAAAAQLPWARIVRRPYARELLTLWYVGEIPMLYWFCYADDGGRALYLPAAMVVVVATAALYPPAWVITLGALALAGFLGLLTMGAGEGVTFVVGMSAVLTAAVGLSARTAANRQRQDARRRSAERRTEVLLANASDAVLAVGPDGTVRYASPGVQDMLGHQPAWLIGTRLDPLVHADDLPQLRQWLTALMAAPEGEASRCEVRIRRADGGWISADVIGAQRLTDPDLGAAVLSIRDISARRALEEELTKRAFADSLTGLANRALFRDRLEHAVARHRRGGGTVTLLLIDLDNFKMINDTLGHAAGDELLVTVADRLRAEIRPADTLARLGGDEFAVLIEDLDQAAACAFAERILAVMRQPVALAARQVVCGMSIGIASATADTGTEDLLRDADLAMYAAKRGGRDAYAVFNPAMHEEVLREARQRAELETALAEDQFFLQYQSIVDLPSGRVLGVEALVRWQHPRDGVVGPDQFIPLAEETGLIVPLGRWVLRRACAQLAQWQRDVPAARDLYMSVNVSPRQFQNVHLAAEVTEAVQAAGVSPDALVLEITESMFLQDTEAVTTVLRDLRASGVRIAIDDFGSGYSSLTYLQRFPVDILKIDRSFVSGGDHQVGDRSIAEAVIQIGRALRLTTVAEGVETDDQWAQLHAMGCDLGQGYYFARPGGAGQIEALLTARSRTGRDLGPAECVIPARVEHAAVRDS